MSEQLNKLEQQFDSLKTGSITARDFFNAVWPQLAVIKGEATELLNRVYYWAEQQADTAPLTFGLAAIAQGLLAMHEDRLDDMLKFANKARQIFDEQKAETESALYEMMFGALYRTLGNLDLALKYQYSANNKLKASEAFPFFYTASCYQLAELYLETKAYDRSIVTYDDCIQIADKINSPGFKGLALDGKALAYHSTGKNEQAKEAFEKALELCQKGNIANQISRVMSDIGTFYLDLGEYDKAIDYHQQALALRNQSKLFLAAITNMIQLGKIYQLQNQNDAALDIWLQALAKAEELKAKPKISQLHLLLSNFYQSANNAAQTLFHFKAYHEVSEDVNKEDGEKMVKRAEILFAAEQTEKENAIIKAQKAEIEKKNYELQETIDELTITKVSRRAKALTLLIAVVMLIAEEPIMHWVSQKIGEENFYFLMGAKIIIVLSLKPIDSAIEHFLLQRIILNKKRRVTGVSLG